MWNVWTDESPARVAAMRWGGWLWGEGWRAPFAPLCIAKAARPAPLPGGRWVRVRNHLAGLGEGDLDLARASLHSAPHLALPRPARRYLGREVVGQVVEVGLEVSLARLGDRVCLQGEVTSTCETLGLQPPCRMCAAGNAALCEHRALPWPGTGAGWSSEMVVHESQLFLPPEDLGDEQVLLLEPAARAIRAVLRQPLDPGAKVLILGGGALAQLVIAAIRALAPGLLLAVATDLPHQITALRTLEVPEILPRRRAALTQRASVLTNAQQFRQGNARYLLGGFAVVFDCEGVRHSLDQALRLTRSGGTVVLVAGYTDAIQLDPSPLWLDEVSILGVGNAGAEAVPEAMERSVGVRSSNFALAARLMRQGRLRTDTVITHHIPAQHLRHALTVASHPARHRATRVVIVHDSDERKSNRRL